VVLRRPKIKRFVYSGSLNAAYLGDLIESFALKNAGTQRTDRIILEPQNLETIRGSLPDLERGRLKIYCDGFLYPDIPTRHD